MVVPFSEDRALVELFDVVLHALFLGSSQSLERVGVHIFGTLTGNFPLHVALSVEANFGQWARFVVHQIAHCAPASVR